MNNIKQIFADGIGNINFVNGMVRMDYGTIVSVDGDDEPAFLPEYRIIMPVNSFLAAFTSQKEMIAKMEEKQIISKTEENQEQ